MPAFENLTGLERLPLRGASIVALPMKIGGGSGAPLRAVAILPPTPLAAITAARRGVHTRCTSVSGW